MSEDECAVKKPEEPVLLKKIADLPRVRSDQFVSVYSNHTEAAPGFYELTLIVSRIAKKGNELHVEEQAEIIYSWEHAVRVRDLLSRMIKAYEDQEGNKIRILSEDEPSTVADPKHDN